MKIQQLLEAGNASYDFDAEMPTHEVNRRDLADKIRQLGGGKAMDEMVADTGKMIFRGIKNAGNVLFMQNTWASERRAQNTSNWVNLLTEVLPSWKRANIPARSKIVACSSSYNKAAMYGKVFVVLPTDDSVCTYTRTHDFWDGFDGLNHIYGDDEDSYGAIPAVNEALDQFAEQHAYPKATNAQQVLQMLTQMKADLDNGELTVEELNPELRALFESEPGDHDIISILDNLLDPSHMPTTTGGNLIKTTNTGGWGEEVAVAGKIIYVNAEQWYEHINRWD